MNRRNFLGSSMAAAAAIITACNSPSQAKTKAKPGTAFKGEISRSANPWTHLNFYNDPRNFHFAIVSDRTGYFRPGIFNQAMEKLNLLLPEFVMSVGDLIEGNDPDVGGTAAQWDEFDSMVNKLKMPFFYVPGNHDHGHWDSLRINWQKRLGRSYYYFIYHNVLFLCLNSEENHCRDLGSEQIDYFEKVLEKHKNVRWTNVFLHNPPNVGEEMPEFTRLERLLAGRAYTVFAGHIHRYTKEIINKRVYYTLATTGGCARGPGGNPAGLHLEEMDHVMWVTMTDEGPVVANLPLDGILDDDPCKGVIKR